MIKVLFFGDIMGSPGREGVIKVLPSLKKAHKPDIIMANGENLAHGKGLTKKIYKEMSAAGISFFTSGNHIFERKESIAILRSRNANIIRPANYPTKTPGQGFQQLKIGKNSLIMINLMGRVFFSENLDCPFREAEKIINRYRKTKNKCLCIDFHAEATSEKKALWKFLDGRVAAVWGTHTHVQTADEEISEAGTAYITDVGMCGALDSVIGGDKEIVIKRFLTQLPMSIEPSKANKCLINAILLKIDAQTNKAVSIKRIKRIVSIS